MTICMHSRNVKASSYGIIGKSYENNLARNKNQSFLTSHVVMFRSDSNVTRTFSMKKGLRPFFHLVCSRDVLIKTQHHSLLRQKLVFWILDFWSTFLVGVRLYSTVYELYGFSNVSFELTTPFSF